jgi:hypothetical protein
MGCTKVYVTDSEGIAIISSSPSPAEANALQVKLLAKDFAFNEEKTTGSVMLTSKPTLTILMNCRLHASASVAELQEPGSKPFSHLRSRGDVYGRLQGAGVHTHSAHSHSKLKFVC